MGDQLADDHPCKRPRVMVELSQDALDHSFTHGQRANTLTVANPEHLGEITPKMETTRADNPNTASDSGDKVYHSGNSDFTSVEQSSSFKDSVLNAQGSHSIDSKVIACSGDSNAQLRELTCAGTKNVSNLLIKDSILPSKDTHLLTKDSFLPRKDSNQLAKDNTSNSGKTTTEGKVIQSETGEEEITSPVGRVPKLSQDLNLLPSFAENSCLQHRDSVSVPSKEKPIDDHCLLLHQPAEKSTVGLSDHESKHPALTRSAPPKGDDHSRIVEQSVSGLVSSNNRNVSVRNFTQSHFFNSESVDLLSAMVEHSSENADRMKGCESRVERVSGYRHGNNKTMSEELNPIEQLVNSSGFEPSRDGPSNIRSASSHLYGAVFKNPDFWSNSSQNQTFSEGIPDMGRETNIDSQSEDESTESEQSCFPFARNENLDKNIRCNSDFGQPSCRDLLDKTKNEWTDNKNLPSEELSSSLLYEGTEKQPSVHSNFVGKGNASTHFDSAKEKISNVLRNSVLHAFDADLGETQQGSSDGLRNCSKICVAKKGETCEKDNSRFDEHHVDGEKDESEEGCVQISARQVALTDSGFIEMFSNSVMGRVMNLHPFAKGVDSNTSNNRSSNDSSSHGARNYESYWRNERQENMRSFDSDRNSRPEELSGFVSDACGDPGDWKDESHEWIKERKCQSEDGNNVKGRNRRDEGIKIDKEQEEDYEEERGFICGGSGVSELTGFNEGVSKSVYCSQKSGLSKNTGGTVEKVEAKNRSQSANVWESGASSSQDYGARSAQTPVNNINTPSDHSASSSNILPDNIRAPISSTKQAPFGQRFASAFFKDHLHARIVRPVTESEPKLVAMQPGLCDITATDVKPPNVCFELSSTDIESVQSDNNINALPGTIMLQIFRRLSIYTLLRHVSCVCKYWYNLCRDPSLWRSISLKDQHRLTDNILVQILSFSDRVLQVNLTDCRFVTDVGIRHMLAKCQHLQMLSLMRCFDITDRAFKGLSLSREYSRLQLLHLDGCCKITDLTILQVADACPELRSLHLNQCNKVTDGSISRMADRCPRLSQLLLDHCNMVTDLGLKAVVRNCKRLSYLNIMSCSISDDGLKSLVGLQDLTILDISNIVRLSAESIMFVSRHCRKLECLNLSLNTVVNDECINELARNLPVLKRLYCVSCTITDKGLEAIASFCHTIESLDVGWCQEITDHGVRVVALACPRLEYLGLIRCDRVTLETIEELVEKYPNVNFSTFLYESRRLLERARRDGFSFEIPGP